MLHISLFSGIGGFDLASEWMGWQNIASCEINQFGRKVLEYYWPNAYHHDDIKTLTYTKLNEELTKKHGAEWRADDIVLTGGFPCQPYSLAGKRLGNEDERHLWPEMLRVIREVSPKWIVGENVFGLVNWSEGLVFNEVQTDLETLGYEVQSYVLPACGVNAPHRRDRIFIIAYANNPRNASPRCARTIGKKRGSQQGRVQQPKGMGGERITTNPIGIGHTGRTETTGNDNAERIGRLDTESGRNGNEVRGEVDGCGGATTDTDTSRLHEQYIPSEPNESTTRCRTSYERGDFSSFPTQSPICSRNDGVSSRLDGITFSKWRNESIKAGGNAVVPPLIYNIFKTIQQYENESRNHI